MICWEYNWNAGEPWKAPYNNVWARTMLFVWYNILIDQSENVWYAVEQYGEKTDSNIGT